VSLRRKMEWSTQVSVSHKPLELVSFYIVLYLSCLMVILPTKRLLHLFLWIQMCNLFFLLERWTL
jgi:hypothetical protein